MGCMGKRQKIRNENARPVVKGGYKAQVHFRTYSHRNSGARPVFSRLTSLPIIFRLANVYMVGGNMSSRLPCIPRKRDCILSATSSKVCCGYSATNTFTMRAIR